MANDYTIRLDNQIYQLLQAGPAGPARRPGDHRDNAWTARLHIRFKKSYLTLPPRRPCGPTAWGLCPQTPGVYRLAGIPAEASKAKGLCRRSDTALCCTSRPGARVALLRSPILPKARPTLPKNQPYRPPPNHPWRRKPVISIQ